MSNSEASKPPPRKVRRKIHTPNMEEIPCARNMDRMARCGSPAPIFCATKAESADIKAMGTMARKTNSFSEMPTPAEATRPSVLTMLVTAKFALGRGWRPRRRAVKGGERG